LQKLLKECKIFSLYGTSKTKKLVNERVKRIKKAGFNIRIVKGLGIYKYAIYTRRK